MSSSNTSGNAAAPSRTLADHLQDVRETWFSCHPKCRYTWLFSLLGVCYFYVASRCALLIARLMLHMGVLLGGIIAGLSMVAYYKVLKVANREHPVRMAVVTRTKTVPQEPIPGLTQKVIATIRWVDDNHNGTLEEGCEVAQDSASCTTETTRNSVTTDEGEDMDASNNDGEEEENAPEEEEEDGLPKIVLLPEDGISVGDSLTVSLLDGSVAIPFYMPYQKKLVQAMFLKMVKSFSVIVAVLLILRFTMPGLPLAFAPSEQVEAYFQSCWWCQWLLVEEDDEQEQLQDCCSIPWTVTWAYNAFFVVLFSFMCGLSGYFAWIARRAMNGRYEMLRPTYNGGVMTSVATPAGGAND